MFVWGAAATVDRSVIRDVERLPNSQFGYAIDLESRDVHRGMLLLRGSLVERAQTIGIYAAAADVTIESTVVRYMQPGPLSFHGGGGRGLSVQGSKDGSARGHGVVDRSVFQHNQEFGIFVLGSDLEVTSTVIEDTMPQQADQRIGRGINAVTDSVTHVHSTAVIRSSMIRRNHQVGVFLETSDATVESTVIRETLPDASTGLWGAGLAVQLGVAEQESTASVRGCVIADAHQVGISFIGVEATVDSTSVSRTKPEEASGYFGDGIVVSSFYGSPATAMITRSRIEASARAGISVFGSSASVSTTTLECQAIHLDAEQYQSLAPEVHDLGGNVCGCAGESVTCQVVSSSLAPPTPLDAQF
jgi:hypothetical protein